MCASSLAGRLVIAIGRIRRDCTDQLPSRSEALDRRRNEDMVGEGRVFGRLEYIDPMKVLGQRGVH
jgi:hypothetical protein